ncbi:MAG: hypothetical protein V4819_18890 [Verrucomicrobiota bacterium]
MNHYNLVARIAAELLVSLFLGVSAHAQSPTPSFPVGNLVVSPFAGGGTRVQLAWSITLPAGATASNYVHYIRQTQLPADVTWDASVAVSSSGVTLSPLLLEADGSKFELWTVQLFPLVESLLDTTVISPYVPTAEVTIRSEDPYSLLPRTRADRPFYVDVTVQGILSGQNYPDISKGVSLIRQAQSYGSTGTGDNLDRNQATLISHSPITTNGTQTLTFVLNSISGADRAKVRGEERISVFCREDYLMPETVIDSKFIQVWPVADGTITGIAPGQTIWPVVPEVAITLNDLYPSSTTWVQVYKGNPQPGITGTNVPGTSLQLNDAVPVSHLLKLDNYGSVFDSDGLWTMEVLTKTPFGTDRIVSVSFTVQGIGMTLEAWRLTHFGSTSNSGDGADLNDFDMDGLPNLVEFAFGFDPKENSAGQLAAPQNYGNNRVISFTQPPGINGITYGAEWSSNLLPGSWNPITDTAAPPQHTFSVPIDTHPNLYLRLKVTGQ